MSISPTGQAATTPVATELATRPELAKPRATVMRVSHEQPIDAPNGANSVTSVPAPTVPATSVPAPIVPTTSVPTTSVPAQAVTAQLSGGIPLQPMIPSASSGIMLSPLLPGSVVAAPNTPNRATETAPRSAPTGAFTLQPLPRGGQSVEVPPQHVAGLPFAVLPMARYDNSGAPLQAKSKLDVAAMTGPMVDPLMMFQQLNTQTPAPGPIAAPQRSTDNYIPWGQSTYTWYTPVFAHNPLYFEQPNLERYGIGTYRWLQPAASSAHFFTSIGLMPYKVLTQHPRESVYTLGFERPGNCATYQGRPVLGQSRVGEVFKYWDSCSGYK